MTDTDPQYLAMIEDGDILPDPEPVPPFIKLTVIGLAAVGVGAMGVGFWLA